MHQCCKYKVGLKILQNGIKDNFLFNFQNKVKEMILYHLKQICHYFHFDDDFIDKVKYLLVLDKYSLLFQLCRFSVYGKEAAVSLMRKVQDIPATSAESTFSLLSMKLSGSDAAAVLLVCYCNRLDHH